MTQIGIPGRTATDIAGKLAVGELDAQTLTEQTLTAVADADPAIFTLVTAERARVEAEAAARRRTGGMVRSPLDGVPIAWKDLFDLRGHPTTAGSRVLAGARPADADAAVVEALAAAGMITIGRVNMTEFAYSGLGLNPHFGTPANPHGRDVPRVPGGSSSGSGVSVARGLVPVSIGSDTGGSVRIPAAFNGIVGYKSSLGRYPMRGVFPLSVTLDTLGILCRSVADAVMVDAAMRGQIPSAPAPVPLSAVRLAVPTNVVLDGCEQAVRDNFDAALAALVQAGATVERTGIAAFDQILDLHARYGTIIAAEAFALHRTRVEGPDAMLMDRRVVARLRAAGSLDPAGTAALRAARGDLIAATAKRYAGTIIAFPTVPHVAPPIAPLEADDERFSRINLLTLRNTSLGNVLDWCGVTLPTGLDADGLPTAILLCGMPGSDDTLLRTALSAERLVPPFQRS